MIIIDKISNCNIFIYKFLAFIGFKLYVYNHQGINKEYYFKKGFIKKIEFKSKDTEGISALNYIKNKGKNPYSEYLPIESFNNLKNAFLNITNLRNKVIHIIENMFWSLETNNIFSFISTHNRNEKYHFVIHNNLLSYWFNCRKKDFKYRIINIYLPLDDLNKY